MSSKQHTRKREGPGRGCQVQGCTDDLSCSKEYHRKHKVCEKHSKFPKVIVRGLEQRFCQQCSRFHSLEEFDEGKRSCRKRLAGHNERRRKPPGASKASTSMLLASTFGNYQQNSLTGNGTAFICQGRLCGNAQNLKMINHEVPYWPSNVRIENQVTGFPDPKSIGYNRFNALFCYNSGKSLPFLSSSRTKPDVYNMGNSAMDSPFRHFISFPSSKSDATSSSQGSSFVQDSPAIVDRSSALSLLSSPVWSSKFKESVPMHMKSSVYRLKELPKQDYQTSTALSFMETRNGVFNLEEKSLAVSSNLSEGLQSGNYTDNIYFMDEKQGAGCLLNLDEANVPGQGPLHMKMKDVQQVCSMTQKSYVHDLGNTGISGHGPHPSQYSF